MNQKLKAIQDILTSLEKDRELSFEVFSKILVKQKLNLDTFNKVQQKYEGIDECLDGVVIFNSLGNKTLDYFYRRNFYKNPSNFIEKFLHGWRWSSVPDGDFYTIFRIKDGESFITSFLGYLDNLKHDAGIMGTTLQRREVTKLLEKTRDEFGKETFTLEMPLKKYFNDKIEYYRVIRETPNLKITNINIFDGKIYFSIQMKDSESIKDREITWEEKGSLLHMSYGGRTKKFKKGRNSYHIVKESLSRETNELIDFAEMIDKLTGKGDQDKMKMVYNAVNYANNEIEKELKIGGFFGVEEKAYRRQLDVIKL